MVQIMLKFKNHAPFEFYSYSSMKFNGQFFENTGKTKENFDRMLYFLELPECDS